MIKIGPI